ncbi:hypothetical protein ACP0AK_00515 [Listeria ivanovii]|nr:hypothetical protein [Listeria ivanovii]AHI57294.1 hypothetical protein AX25_08425 [Listeria ivanovii WSLC3009]MBC1759473.1 hypothetical protein [Listeria ivanovii]MBK3914278.1 hypothetical protein [Listeria ivanovii subsp. ivanovii]MBK3921823.1 hypothetical protein [Listeria ivanovii subsp. ivanovii]MBK3926987.1 hypothetical protein [Listeria ivanovii subsp. ivanovii]
MAKYDDGFKRKVVEAYQNGEGGYGTLAHHLLCHLVGFLMKKILQHYF